MSTSSSDHTVTIAGGGIAALEAVLALRDLAGGVGLELFAPQPDADYRPLSVLEPFALGEMPSLDLARFAEEHGAVLHRDTLVAVEPGERTLVTGKGARREYAILVVAAGATALESISTTSVLVRGALRRCYRSAPKAIIRRAVPTLSACRPLRQLGASLRRRLSSWECGSCGFSLLPYVWGY